MAFLWVGVGVHGGGGGGGGIADLSILVQVTKGLICQVQN